MATRSRKQSPAPSSKSGAAGAKVAQSQQLAVLPKTQLEEFSQAVELTTQKFDKLMRSTEEMVQKSAQTNPGEGAKAQDKAVKEVEEHGFKMIDAIFGKLGGQKAVQSFMEKRYPSMYRDHEPTAGDSQSMRQSSVVGGPSGPDQNGFVTSQLTNQRRSMYAQNGKVQPFDQVMSNFAMYGLGNRGAFVGKEVETTVESQMAVMQEMTGLCLKIYRSVNLRFQRIAQMMLSGNTTELKDLIETNFCHKMTSYQALVLTRISPDCLMVDESSKRVGIIDDLSLVKQAEVPTPESNAIRSTCLVRGGYLFVGFANGYLQRLDAETLEVGYEIQLHQHIFCIEVFDDQHIICGQMNGWIDLVRIDDGEVALSKELKHVTGNITLIKKTMTPHEIIIGTQRGVYVALLGRGLGLREIEMERFNKDFDKQRRTLMLDTGEQSFDPRLEQSTERADAASHARQTDLEGMSQMTFHTTSQFGGGLVQQDDDAEGASSKGKSASVYTKPFTMQSGKNSQGSKLGQQRQSVQSKAATEANVAKSGGILKKKDRQASNVKERASQVQNSAKLPPGSIQQTPKNSGPESIAASAARDRSTSSNKDPVPVSLKKSKEPTISVQQASSRKMSPKVMESQDMVMQSQNSGKFSAAQKGVKHANQELQPGQHSSLEKRTVGSRDPGDSEAPSNLLDDRTQEDPAERSQDAEPGEDNMKFVLCAERYLIGHEIRGIVQLDETRYGVVAWNSSRVYSIDREKPDAVLQFNMPFGEKNCISIRLIPYYDPHQFPFALVLCQTSICCIDFKRYNSFKVCPWRYKGVPNQVNQLEMFLSKEDDQVGEQINIDTLEFDGSNSFVRRLVLDHDCIQALNFLGQD